MYVNDYNNGIIYKIVINTDGTAGAKTTFATVGIYCIGSVVANVGGIDYLFVTNNHGIVSKLSLTSDKSNDNASWFNCGSDSYAMVVYNGVLYIANNGGGRIVQVNLSNPAIYNYTWAGNTQGVLYPVGLVLFDGYIYVSNNYSPSGQTYVNKISLTNHTTDYVSNFITGVSQPSGIAVDSNNYLYILSSSGGTIYKMNNTLLDNINWSVSSSYNTNVGYVAFYGNYIYYPDTFNNRIIQLNLNGTINNLNWASTDKPQAAIVYNGYLYVTNSYQSSVSKFLLSSPGTSSIININSYSPQGLAQDNNYIYVAIYGANSITRISKSDDSFIINWVTGLNQPFGLCIDNGYLYVTNAGNNRISKVSLSNTPTIIYNWASAISANGFLNYPVGIVTNNGYLYVSSWLGNTISKISLSDPSIYVSNWKTSANGLNRPGGLTFNETYIYTPISGTSPQKIARYYLPPTPPVVIPPPPCFKKDTKILTDKGYIPVQYLRKGDLVKTLRNDYKAIHMIGKKLLTHDASQERNKEQLFVYRRDQYPEILEDLVLTGCHSILVDRFSSEQQREKTLKTNGDIYITDNKYRLPACVDEKAVIFEASGEYLIYHIALENQDYYMNYGIYANGLLVETCSKRYLKECSDMTLIGI